MKTQPATAQFPVEINEQLSQRLQTFINTVVDDAGADGVVVNLSGGLDSTVVATLATAALGRDRVYGLILPTDTTRDQNLTDARRVADELAIEYREIPIQHLVDQVSRTVTKAVREYKSCPTAIPKRVTSATAAREHLDEAIGNAAARLRMVLAYFEANTTSRVVIGTGNRTELLLGYFTKYGDGGVDMLPIGDLYKTEVRQLAHHLDVPEHIIEKPPTAGLWVGQTDESELGAAYETIDPILHSLVDLDHTVPETAETLAVDEDTVRSFAELNAASAHKRTTPSTPGTVEATPWEHDRPLESRP